MMMTSRCSIRRQGRRFLPVLQVLFAILACSLMLFASPTAWADVVDDFRIWGNVTSRGSLGLVNPDLKRWRWWGEIQNRYRESGEELDQLLIRPGIGYALSDRSTVWLGYAHVTNYPPAVATIQENRIWQQFQWSGPTPLGAFTSRTRLEERWQENGNDTGMRFRQFFKFNWPFSFYPDASFVLWDEVFIHMNSTDWGTRKGFDQNRGFAGIGYRVYQNIRTEVGYLNQYINLAIPDRLNHIVSVNLFLDF